jgi:hypothetical protein
MTQDDFRESCVIYYSPDDKCWIAHGLRTDQVGTGDCVVDALADLMKAIDQILALARQEGDIEVLREAPPEIQKRAQSAKQLPIELCEIAHKKVRGTWPAELKVASPETEEYVTRIEEPIPA